MRCECVQRVCVVTSWMRLRNRGVDCKARTLGAPRRGAAGAQRAADLQAAGTTAQHAAAAGRSSALRTSAALVFLHDYNVRKALDRGEGGVANPHLFVLGLAPHTALWCHPTR